MGLFYVIGTDRRTEYIRSMIKREDKLELDINKANYVIAPTPFTKDNQNVFESNISITSFIPLCKDKVLFAGSISTEVKEKFEEENILYYDLMKYDDVAVLNGIPTAEGAIGIAIEKTDITLHGSNVLVLGFGKIGNVLAKMLQGIGANVYCEARNEKSLAQILSLGYNSIDLKDLDKHLSKFDFVFNTIPYMILDKGRLGKLKKDVCIIDLASKPGGTDFEYAKELELNVNHALALPSKVAPKTAAMYLKQKIDYIICSIEGENV